YKEISVYKCVLFLKFTREKLSQAYEFAIDKIGMDYNSYVLWNDYANLLKSVEVSGSYAENQKIMAVRKVYQRGVVTPMANIEQLWKDYLDFERSINPIIAEKMNIERGRDYMNARRVGRELEIETRGLNRHLPSVPPSGLPEELKQVEVWKRYIFWEKDNPLRTDDQTLVTKRVRFAYEQCLLCLSYHPDIWYEAALYLQESSNLLSEKGDVSAAKIFSEEAAQIYERAISGPLRKNQLLHFAYADFEESRLRYQEVHKIYQRYIEMEDIDPTLAYIQYMKFSRRAEGIKSTREIFKKAREDSRTKFHVFVAAALMEYYCTKNKEIAFRIFELGLKKFPNISDYIMAYVDYLSHLNEDNNTRVLFERVLTSGQLKNEDTVGLWNRFLEFECNVGDLASIVKVEKRRAFVLQKLQEFEGKDTAQLVDRYKFMDLYPCTPPELKGPFVKIDHIIDIFMKINIPEQGTSTSGQWSNAAGQDVRLFELSKSVHWVIDSSGDRKRRLVLGEDSDDDDGNKPLLTSDIYRARQQKKIKAATATSTNAATA
ncbi:Cleavage stimulation factor subunit 3, partial [Armadillidium vulgare]